MRTPAGFSTQKCYIIKLLSRENVNTFRQLDAKIEAYGFIYWHSCKTKQHKNSRTDKGVGLDVKHSNCYKINLPFEIKIEMPKTDLGKKGYSPTFAERLAKDLSKKR